MPQQPASDTENDDIYVGNTALLTVLGQHFMVKIKAVDEDTILVSFPPVQYPVKGMEVQLEFHDLQGLNVYHSEVVKGPDEGENGMVLRRPQIKQRSLHRSSCRVPTDLSVQVKDQARVRRHDASLVDLSLGGAMIETDAPFDLDTTLEMSLSLPGEPTHQLIAHVVHILNSPETPYGRKKIGIKFDCLDSAVEKSIMDYIWNRLREMYPTSS